MWTIYSYWNNASIIQALNAIVLVMGGSDWLGLMQTMGLIGLLVAAGIGLMKISFKEPAQYVVMLMILYSVLFVPKVTVAVVDVRSGGVGSVANVPMGVAFISSVTSHVGKYLTETFETAFGGGDELKFSRTGMAWGAGAMRQLSDVRPQNPKAQEAFSNFSRACVVPEIIDDSTKYVQLTNSTNILTTIAAGRGTAGGWINPGRVVSMPNMGSAGYTVVPCIDVGGASAYDQVVAWLNAEVAGQRGWLARTLLPDAAPATANVLIATYLPGVEGAIIGSTRAITEQIMQSMTVNLMNESAGSLALVRGDPGAVQLAVGTATAQASATSAYRVMGMIGAEALPKMRNIIEIMLISVFPIVLLVIILAGDRGGGPLKAYAMTAVWVQLWAPLYAVINNMLTPMTAARFQAAMGGSVSQTMQNTSAMLQTGFSEQAMAGALVMAVPLIAYALVRGGEVAMSSAMGMISGTAASSAQTQGGAAGLGNVQMGNTSWGNHSANSMAGNKWDDAGSISQGKWHSSSDVFQGNYGTSSGAAVMNASGSVSDMGEYGAVAKGSMATAATAGMTNSWQQATESAQSFATQAQSAWSAFTRNTASSSSGNGVQISGGSSKDASSSVQASRGLDMVKNAAKEWGVADSQAFAAILSAGAQTGAGTGGLPGPSFQASIGGKMDMASRAENQNKFASAQKIAQSAEFKAASQAVDRAGVSREGTQSADARSGAEKGRDSALSGAMTSLDQSRTAASRADAYQKTLSSTQSMDGAGTRNLGNALVRELGGVNSARQAIASGDSARIESAMGRVVEREVARQMGGNFTPDRGAGVSAGGARGAAIQTGTESRTGGVEGAVAGGGASVQASGQTQAGALRGPVGTASLGGSTAGGMIAAAGGQVTATKAGINSDGVRSSEQGVAIQGEVQDQQAWASKGGALPEKVVQGAADALRSTGTNVVEQGRKLGSLVTGGGARASNNNGWKDAEPMVAP